MLDNQKTNKKLLKSLKDVEKMIVLMKKHKVSSIKLEGVSISIEQFEAAPMVESKEISREGSDEDLFWSAHN